MDIGEILSKSGKIVWKYKVLWIFGFFASCSANGNTTSGARSSVSYNYDQLPFHLDSIDAWVWVVLSLLLLALIIAIVLIVATLSTFGRIGIVQGTVLADRDEDAQITFSGLLQSGKPFFWRVLGMNLLIALGFFAAFIIIGMFFIGVSVFTFGLGLFCLLPLLCVLVPAIWLLTIFVEMANAAIVVDDLSVTEGIQRGWTVFKENLGNMTIMGLILVLGGAGVSLVLALPFMLALAPLIIGLFSMAVGTTDNFPVVAMALAGLCVVAYWPILIVTSSILRAYVLSAWTLTYLRLTRDEFGNFDLIPDPEPLSPPDVERLPDEVDDPPEQSIPPETVADPEPEQSPPLEEDELPEDF